MLGDRTVRLAAAASAIALLAVLTPLVAASGSVPPSQDSFYTYTGPRPLATIPPGTVLKQRSVKVAFGTMVSTPIHAEQLLYRTSGQLGQPTVTVTTVITPVPVPVVPRLVEYLSFYDGLGSQCDPSYTLAGGDPGGPGNRQEAVDEELAAIYLSERDILTIPDFEGTRLAWMAGRESGYGSLDAVKATESYLGLGRGTKVGLSGYSGGAMAADWASELAPAYAPDLNIVGVAEGGIPANYIHMFDYINGTPVYSAAIPGMLIGLSRAYGVDLTRYVSPLGRKIVQQEDQVCIGAAFGKYPGLTINDLMLPAYRNLGQVAPFAGMLGDQTMGNAATHPRGPLLMGNGNADGRGDGAMVLADVKALAHKYCTEGVPVTFQEYKGASHEAAGAFFEPQTGPFLQARFAGVPFVNTCASLGS